MILNPGGRCPQCSRDRRPQAGPAWRLQARPAPTLSGRLRPRGIGSPWRPLGSSSVRDPALLPPWGQPAAPCVGNGRCAVPDGCLRDAETVHKHSGSQGRWWSKEMTLNSARLECPVARQTPVIKTIFNWVRGVFICLAARRLPCPISPDAAQWGEGGAGLYLRLLAKFLQGGPGLGHTHAHTAPSPSPDTGTLNHQHHRTHLCLQVCVSKHSQVPEAPPHPARASCVTDGYCCH